jgi:prevent-host-death family protein
MSITANVHEAKSTLSKLIERALQGEEVIIARNGTPVVRLTPVHAVPQGRKGGRWAGSAKEVDARWWEPDEETARLFEESEIFPSDPRA